jgi:hypothetical protein
MSRHVRAIVKLGKQTHNSLAIPTYQHSRAGFGMHKDEVNERLASAYHRWKADFDAKDLSVEHFSPPLLLNVTDEYCNAPLKVLVYGQETKGWGWTHRLRECYPDYPQNWPFHDLCTFADFLTHNDAIEGLIWGYEQFAFAKSQPESYRSPFWQAFREIQKWPGAGVMHSDLVRVDYDGRSIFNAESNARQAILRQQNPLLRDELKALKPSACIFLTGPDYDFIIKDAFPGIRCNQIGAPPERELARLVHDDLPINSYRTYHPKALSLQRKGDYLQLIQRSLTQ